MPSSHFYGIVSLYDTNVLYNCLFPCLSSGTLTKPDINNIHMIVDNINTANSMIEAYTYRDYNKIPAMNGVSTQAKKWAAIQLNAYTTNPPKICYYDAITGTVYNEYNVQQSLMPVCMNIHYKHGIVDIRAKEDYENRS